MSENDSERETTFCRVCWERMLTEDGKIHDECHEAAKEEFAWYQ